MSPPPEASSSKMDNSGDRPLKVPGIGLPIDFEFDEDHRYLHAVNDFKPHRSTAREIDMVRVMNSLTDKPEWYKKVHDEEIVAKWREEASDVAPSVTGDTFDWCIRELRDKAAFFAENRFITTLETSTRCVKSDALVSDELRQRLVRDVQVLLNSPEKDWHPRSGDQVLNLVHPSLYPLVWGRTPVMMTGRVGLLDALHFSGKGEIPPADGKFLDDGSTRRGNDSGFWSRRFQWLPCDVAFKGEEGSEVQISSYINNLHPNKHPELYQTIEQIMSLAIEPWNYVLSKDRSCLEERPSRTGFPTAGTWSMPYDEEEFGEAWRESMPIYREEEEIKEQEQGEEKTKEEVAKVARFLAIPEPSNRGVDYNDDGEFEDSVAEFPDGEWRQDDSSTIRGLIEEKNKRLRKFEHPVPTGYDGWQTQLFTKETNLQTDFRKKGLQVIVKLANIELTPDNPTYEGGSWHIEGMLNEHIAATAIYYYDVSNTTPSRIHFRQEAGLEYQDMSYEQDDHGPLCTVYGCDSLREVPAIQDIGSITTPEGRLLVFPNTLQHRVDKFELLDRTRPGHRRFLVLWLVDPHYRIASTANVAPQQHEWISEKKLQMDEVNKRLPPELADFVWEEASKDLMGMDEAKALRLELMDERTRLVQKVESCFEEYNFCEH